MKPVTPTLPRALPANPPADPTPPPAHAAPSTEYQARMRPIRGPLSPGRRDPRHSIGRPRTTLLLAALALGIIAWSAGFRLPAARRAARIAHTPRPVTTSASTPLDSSHWSELQIAAREANQRLLQNRAEFRDLLTEIEHQAVAEGWQIETQVQPQEPGPDSLTNLVVYPVTATLGTDIHRSTPAYDGLLRWLDGLSRSAKTVQIASVLMIGDANGLTKARVELRLLGRPDHEPHATP